MVQADDFYAIRKRLGLSQEKLAEKLGVSRHTVSRWERGNFNPSAENMIALNRLFAELEESAAQKEEPAAPLPEASAPQTQEAPPEPKPIHKRQSFWVMCALAVSVLAMMVALCIGLYLTNAKLDRLLPEDNATPIEELVDEEVDISQIESATRQPLQP